MNDENLRVNDISEINQGQGRSKRRFTVIITNKMELE